MKQMGETLLIVDDSRFQRAVLREMLQDSFELIEVTCGEECLELLSRSDHNITMVLLDLVMPGIDGFEVLRRRRQMETFQNIPVIVLTTSNENYFQTDAFELGADEYLIKPVDAGVALSRINNILGARRRIKALLKEQEELKVMTQIDAMTKLFNKSMSEQLITKTLTEGVNGQHALMVIDIDNFKAVNDIFGHKVGDHVIVVVAGVIASLFGTEDYVGRIGGDEFIVFMRGVTSRDAAARKAQELIQIVAVKENLTIPDNISLSIGLAFSDGSEKHYAEFFEKADHALYLAKKAGKGCYFEYGAQREVVAGTRSVLVWTASRNVHSILEFVYHHPVLLESVSSVEEIHESFLAGGRHILAVYIDVSARADAGEAIWKEMQGESWLKKTPLIAVCQEGELKQLRYAVESGLIDDLLLAPLEAETVARRAGALKLVN